jgi:hypothetical protein
MNSTCHARGCSRPAICTITQEAEDPRELTGEFGWPAHLRPLRLCAGHEHELATTGNVELSAELAS